MVAPCRTDSAICPSTRASASSEMSGPTSVAGSIGSPSTTPFTKSINRRVNSSAIDSST